MSSITKFNITRQSVINQYTFEEISELIENGQTLLYKREDGSLGMVSKEDDIVEDINPGGNMIKNLIVPDLPQTFPPANKAYALCAARDGSKFKLVWALIDTIEDYNS
jgi:hypothetical protein